MQAKPPLACHANLVAEWGGVALREGSGRTRLRELGFEVGWGGGKQTSPLCASKCNNEPPLNHISTLNTRVCVLESGCSELSASFSFVCI